MTLHRSVLQSIVNEENKAPVGQQNNEEEVSDLEKVAQEQLMATLGSEDFSEFKKGSEDENEKDSEKKEGISEESAEQEEEEEKEEISEESKEEEEEKNEEEEEDLGESGELEEESEEQAEENQDEGVDYKEDIEKDGKENMKSKEERISENILQKIVSENRMPEELPSFEAECLVNELYPVPKGTDCLVETIYINGEYEGDKYSLKSSSIKEADCGIPASTVTSMDLEETDVNRFVESIKDYEIFPFKERRIIASKISYRDYIIEALKEHIIGNLSLGKKCVFNLTENYMLNGREFVRFILSYKELNTILGYFADCNAELRAVKKFDLVTKYMLVIGA